jgi:hypothetical protein
LRDEAGLEPLRGGRRCACGRTGRRRLALAVGWDEECLGDEAPVAVRGFPFRGERASVPAAVSLSRARIVDVSSGQLVGAAGLS